MRRFKHKLIVGLVLAVFVGGITATQANALVPNAPRALTASQLATIDLCGGDSDCSNDLTCGDDDTIDFGITDGLHIPDFDSLLSNYVICPLLSVVYGSVGLMLNALEGTGLLQVQPLLQNGGPVPQTTSDGGTESLYAAWAVFRDVANFGLIAGLFLIVFSQATSYGLSAYGVRKMLPKLVVAALLVNLSFVICAVLVDVFNILGSSLDDTLYNAITSRVNGTEGEIISRTMDEMNAPDWTILLMGFTLLLVLFALLLIGLLCLMFLVARQILIIILIMASPLAFIAWLFPNTESSFRKWWSTLIRLLAIYPVVMCLKVVVVVVLVAMETMVQ